MSPSSHHAILRDDYQTPSAKFDIEYEEKDGDDNEYSPCCVNWNQIRTVEYWKEAVIGCLAELIGSAIFLYVAILAIQTNMAFNAAFAAGFTICMLVIALGNISGGHFNPVVSIAFFAIGETSLIRCVLYIISQMIGAVIGASFAKAILSHSIVMLENGVNITQFEHMNGGAHYLRGGITPGLAILAEAIFAFTMMMVVFSACVDSRTKSSIGPLTVGMVITICIMAGWENTSGSFNPTRSFGSAVAISDYLPRVWDHHYVYWVGPTIGSLLAALVYRTIFADEEHTITKNILRII